MNKIVDYLKNYIGIISIVLAVCLLLTYSLSYFKVNGGSKRAAEMYIGELKYTISIDGASTNTLTVPVGETIVDVDLTNLNEIKTYYKLLFLNNSNILISYFNQGKNTSEEVTNYKAPSDSVESKAKNILKLKIENNSTSKQTITFKVSGGYSTNTLGDVEVPNTYTEITSFETPSTNTYFCKTNDTLTQGLEYVNGQYTYMYRKEGKYVSSGLAWDNISLDGWGVQLTDKTSTDPVTSKVCTYVNNKPVVSMDYMFGGSQASTIDLSSFNTSEIKNMSYMFSRTAATTLDLSKLNTSNVTNMSYMFYNSKVTTLNLSNLDTSKVTDMTYMFGSVQATSLDVSSFNTSNVKKMSAMFFGTKATALDLSNFDTSNVTSFSMMFLGSYQTTLDLSNFNTSNATDMNSMFARSSVTSLIGLNNFDTSKVKNMNRMFENVSAKLDVSNFDTSNVTDMGTMFSGVNVTTLDLSNFNTSKVTNMSYMFYNSKITALYLSNFDTGNVTNMGYMFYNSEATTIDLSNFNTSNVTNMSFMFYKCKTISLDISSFDTSKVTVMDRMFMSCDNLKTIYVSDKFVTTNVTESTNMFEVVYNLVGGSGTKYNSSYVDKTYARIDGGTSNPGYFTDVADKNIPAPNSFNTDSWKTIIKAVKDNNTSKYNVGDTKTVSVGSYGTHTLRIANKSTPSSCNSNGFSQSACGFVLEFVDIVDNNQMNEVSESFGGWASSKGMVYVNNIYNALPEELKSGIINTYTISGHPLGDRASIESTDKLYLLAAGEIYKDWSDTNDSSHSKTRQLDYYSNNNVTTSSYSLARKKSGSTYTEWWLRSATFEDSNSFYIIYSDGNLGTEYAIEVLGLSPAFRIG